MPPPLSRVRSINFLNIGDNFSKLDLMQWHEIFFSANFRPICKAKSYARTAASVAS